MANPVSKVAGDPNFRANGKFAPGNQVAKKPRNRQKSLIYKVSTKEEREELFRGIFDRALAGSDADARYLADKMIPPLKAEAKTRKLNIDLTDMTSAVTSLLQSCSDGILPVDQAKMMIEALKGAGEVSQLQVMAQRLADLEARLSSQPAALPQQPVSAPVVIDASNPITPEPVSNGWESAAQELVK